MAERRGFARKKRRFLVEFILRGAACTGFTYDVSPTGIFVRSIRLPDPGTFLTANLHLPHGKSVAVRGKVVRSFRVPPGSGAFGAERLFDPPFRLARRLLPVPLDAVAAALRLLPGCARRAHNRRQRMRQKRPSRERNAGTSSSSALTGPRARDSPTTCPRTGSSCDQPAAGPGRGGFPEFAPARWKARRPARQGHPLVPGSGGAFAADPERVRDPALGFAGGLLPVPRDTLLKGTRRSLAANLELRDRCAALGGWTGEIAVAASCLSS